MCARFVLKKQKQDLAAFFDLKLSLDLPPRYNIAPTQQILAIRDESTGRRAALLTWGLVPQWAKDPAISAGMINARSETLAAKPAFRDAFRYRRCLIPADGFYEWETIGKAKQPWYIHRTDGQTAAFAGLWEHWQDPNGTEIESCTIITTRANAVLQPFHDRMPVILEREQWKTWLSPASDGTTLQQLFTPLPAEKLKAYPVSTRVNNARNDEPTALDRVEPLKAPAPARPAQEGLFGDLA